MNADELALEFSSRSAGLLDRLFGQDDDPLDAALKDIGKQMNRSWPKLAPKILSRIADASKKSGVNPDYLNYVLFQNRASWPVKGKLATALEIAVEIVMESGRQPRYPNLPAREDDAQVDAAIKDVAMWAATDLAKQLKSVVVAAASDHSRPLRRKLDTDVTPLEMAQYIISKFRDRLKQHTSMFENSYLLSQIVNRLLFQ